MELDVIYNQDCIQGMKMIPDKSIDLIVTDPPYFIENTKAGGKSQLAKSIQKMNDEIKENNLINGFNIKILDELVRVMKNINIYIWCNSKQIPMYFDYFVKQWHCSFDILIWNKTNAMPLFNNKYLSDKEYCLYFRKSAYCNPHNYEEAKTVFYQPINIKDKKRYGHPTIKPLNIVETLIKNSSKEGQIILDPFLGSGTTAVAAVNTDRHYIGFELEPKYFDIACNRLDDAERERERTIIFLFDDVKGGEIMVLWNILAGLLCFFGGFVACIGVIWLITNVIEKVSEYDEYDYYD